VGTEAWILLLLDEHRSPLLLQVKEADTSVLEQFISKSKFSNHERVVAGQHLMQAASDILLGWERFDFKGYEAAEGLCDLEEPPRPAISRDPARLSIVTASNAGDGREALLRGEAVMDAGNAS
jgi:Uncharacterized protein conserved in bacteria (DUF2252)